MKLGLLVGTATLLAAGAASAQTLPEAIAGGKPILETRLRSEAVGQTGFASDAEALTLRTRLGWETGSWNKFKGLIEFEDVRDLGSGDYNDGVPPAEAFPVVADPEVTELNRLQVTWTPSTAFSATVGRQRVNLDDQRFIGAVGWRQDEQTLDAAKVDLTLGKVKGSIAYVTQINRVFADALDYDSESVLANVTFAASDLFTPTAFVYALDLPTAAAQSTVTSGVRVVGKAPAGPYALSWAGAYASQGEHGDNPGAFDLSYLAGEVSVARGPLTFRAAFESLEGDGTRGFSTPLATLHAFNGWADVFLTTPAAGLEDIDLGLTWRTPFTAPLVTSLALVVRYHDYEAELTGADLGEELNLQATAQMTPRLQAIVKYADYQGVPGFADRDKLWISLEFKL